jgi:hypothetical protein
VAQILTTSSTLPNPIPCWPLQMTIREALNSAIDEEMERDDTVVLIGSC